MYVFEFMKRAVKNVGTWRALHLPIPSPDMACHVPIFTDVSPDVARHVPTLVR